MGFLAVMTAQNASAELRVSNDILLDSAKLSIAEDHHIQVVNLRFTFEGAGAATDVPGARGLAHFTAQMLQEGAGDLDSEAFGGALAASAIHISADVDEDHLTISLQSLSSHLPKALDLLQSMLVNPRFAPDDIDRLRAQLTAQLHRLKESPRYLASRLLKGHLFAHHPYNNPVLGVAQDIARIDKSQMQDFMKTYITRGNLLISAAGDIREKTLKKMLKPLVKSLPKNEMGPSGVARAVLASQGRILKETIDVPQSIITFAMPWIARDDEQFYMSYLLNRVLGAQGLSSLLMQDLRGGDDGYVYHVSTHLSLHRGANLLIGFAATRNDQVDEVIEKITQRFESIKQHGLTLDQCQNGKSFLLGRQPLQLDSTAAIADMLRMMQLYDLPENYLQKRAAYVRDIDCNAITALAASLFDENKVTFAVVGGSADFASGANPQ
jgi:zinc protease